MTLDAVMPDGLDVVAVAESPGGALADLLTASRWRIDTAADPAALADAVRTFLATESVLVERMTKKGLREFDCRAAVHSLVADGVVARPGAATTPCPRSGPTTCSPGCAGSPASRSRARRC